MAERLPFAAVSAAEGDHPNAVHDPLGQELRPADDVAATAGVIDEQAFFVADFADPAQPAEEIDVLGGYQAVFVTADLIEGAAADHLEFAGRHGDMKDIIEEPIVVVDQVEDDA